MMAGIEAVVMTKMEAAVRINVTGSAILFLAFEICGLNWTLGGRVLLNMVGWIQGSSMKDACCLFGGEFAVV